jgi:hypothetical protein
VEIKAETIAKDTLRTMSLAGIDTSVFKAHSTRLVAASAALQNGMTVDEVVRMGRWSSFCVFMNFYNRAKPRQNVTATILGRSSNINNNNATANQ